MWNAIVGEEDTQAAAGPEPKIMQCKHLVDPK